MIFVLGLAACGGGAGGGADGASGRDAGADAVKKDTVDRDVSRDLGLDGAAGSSAAGSGGQAGDDAGGSGGGEAGADADSDARDGDAVDATSGDDTTSADADDAAAADDAIDAADDAADADDAVDADAAANDDGGAGATGDDAAGGAGGGAPVCPAVPDAGVPSSLPDNVVFLGNVTVSTIAGSDTEGYANGTAAQALFSDPVSVTLAPGTGDLIVCDFENDALRRVTMPSGTVAVSALTMQATFTRPYGVVFGHDGMLYVDTDYDTAGGKSDTSGTIWKVDPTTGVAAVVAPSVGRPRGLAALSDGRLVLGDYQNARLRLLDPATGTASDFVGLPGCPGFADGQGAAARLGVPYGVAVMPDGRIIVADQTNHRLRAVTAAGVVSTYAGDGGDGTIDGPRLAARFSHPTAIAIDAAGDVFVTDYFAHRIRRVAVDGTVTTVAGDGTGGFKDDVGSAAEFYGIEGLAVTADGKTLYVADGTLGDGGPYNRVRRIVIGP